MPASRALGLSMTLGGAVALVGASAAGALTAGRATTATPSAPSLLARTEAAIAAARSMHLALAAQVSVGTSQVGELGTGDIGTKNGSMSVVITNGKSAGPLTTVLVGNTAYCKGAPVALESGCSLTAAQAAKLGSRWVAIPHNAAIFSSTAGGLTLSQGFQGTFPNSAKHFVVRGPSVVDGVRCWALKGPANGSSALTGASETLDVSVATGLPVVIKVAGKGVVESITFSKWNASISIHTPSGAVGLRTI